MKKKFVNGYTSWIETFFLLTDHLTTELRQPEYMEKIDDLRDRCGGFIGLCGEVERWADEFEERNKGREWDGEFYDEIEAFFYEKVEALP